MEVVDCKATRSGGNGEPDDRLAGFVVGSAGSIDAGNAADADRTGTIGIGAGHVPVAGAESCAGGVGKKVSGPVGAAAIASRLCMHRKSCQHRKKRC